MQFLASSAWVFLLIIPLIIVFYLLRQKKEQQVVSSTLLWQKVLADTLSQTPWQRLRRNLLLLLQLLLAVLLVLALMRPYLLRMQEASQDLILLLDTSASMATEEKGGTRMDLAKTELENLVKGQKPGTKFSLITVGPIPQVLLNRTEKPEEILSRLAKVQPGFHQANLEPTLSLVTALLQKGAKAKVFFFSDGSVALPDEPVGIPDFEYRRIGSREDNLAVGAFSLREGPEGPVALTRVDNFGNRELETTVKLFIAGTSETATSGTGTSGTGTTTAGPKLLDVKAVKVAAGKSAHLFWKVPAGAPYLEVRLDLADGLAADNAAWVVPRTGKQNKILLVTTGNIFLEQVLKLNPLLEVHKVNPEGYPNIKEDYRLYVLDGFWPELPPQGQLLVFNPPAASNLVEAAEGVLTGKLQAAQDQPLLNHISWGDVHIAKSKGLKQAGDWQPLLTGGGKAIITIGKTGQARAAVFGFDLHQSDLPLRPAFPILMQNIIPWLLPSGAVRESQVTTGSAVELAVQPQAEEVNLYKPDGTKVSLAPPFPVGKVADTGRPGLYTVEQIIGSGKQLDYLAVNFFSPQDSQVKPVAQLKLGNRDIKARQGVKVNRELWPWLALAGLLFLSLEWWVYLRGH